MDNLDYQLELKNISKYFGKIHALRNANLTVKKGEVMGLVGDNGAGKSTLMKVISGAYIPDEGSIFLKGEKVSFRHPLEAQKKGIGIVYQDLALGSILSVTNNIFMGKLIKKYHILVDDKKMRRTAEETLKKLKTTIKSVDQPVFELSGGQQHSVAVAKLMVGQSLSLVILDEPTAGLGVVEAEKIINLILEMKNSGMTIIFISHNLEHIFRVSDRIAVMVQGSIVSQIDPKKFDRKSVVNMMMGVE